MFVRNQTIMIILTVYCNKNINKSLIKYEKYFFFDFFFLYYNVDKAIGIALC